MSFNPRIEIVDPSADMTNKTNPSPSEGDVAPDFSAAAQDGQTVSLSEFLGKCVVLYFYPRDDTPGCTKEACGFRDAAQPIERSDAVVIGVSPDSVKSHRKFADKFKLPYLLIADEDRAVCQAYGAWGEKKFMGRKYLGVHRVTFLVGKDGRIRKVWLKVKPDEHAAEVLAALQAG